MLQICGQNPSIADAPVIEGAERWILGAAFARQGAGPWDRVFDVHPIEPESHHPGILQTRPDAWAWYQQQTKPIYLRSVHPDVPASVAYPRAAVAAEFGRRAGQALSSSIDHMLALALLEDRHEVIRLEGVRMISEVEWNTQRECLAYWIGVADGMGVEVITDPVSALCTPEVVYGFGEVTGARRAPGVPLPVLMHGHPGMVAA